MAIQKQSFYESLVSGLADAIRDIREKVVEEPWFGRVVNEKHVTELNFGWPPSREVQPEQAEQGKNRDAADIDIDR